jgi:alcohol dehydrogenase
LLAFTPRSGQLRAIQKPLPKAKSGWARVRVCLAGICNTDIEILRGYHNFHGTLGHEFLGEVEEVAGVGQREKRLWSGKRVVGEINIACRALGLRPVCSFCRRGLPRHCARRRVLGIVDQDGAFAEYLTLPLGNLHGVPDSVGDDQAVFAEPVAAACEILEQVAVGRFREAAVLGDGKLAQLIARVLRTELPRIVMYGKHPQKLRLVRQAGIETRQVRGDASDLTRVKDRFALVVEATGSPTGLALAQHMTEPRGTLVLKSTFHGTAPVATWPIVVNELTVVGSRCGSFHKAMALFRCGKVDPRPMISRTLPLEEAAAAIRLAQQPGIMKVLLKNG